MSKRVVCNRSIPVVVDDERYVPDVSDEQREKRLCDLALDVVEERLRNRTASSAEIVQLLKLSTGKTRLEEEKLIHETELLKAKSRAIRDAEQSNADYSKVIEALTRYGATTQAEYGEEM